jgi:tRNA pseudouridine38-40 synthase
VQLEFERVLERLFGHPASATAAGRTDAGVHALGLGVGFAAPASWTAPTLRRALNALLPRDCWVESVHPMRPGFHARKSAVSRRYRYDIGTDDASASPFRRRFRWASAAADLAARGHLLFHGEHDLEPSPPRASPSRTTAAGSRDLNGAPARRHRRELPGGADRFLHHMVRMLVG